MVDHRLTKSCKYFENLVIFENDIDKWNHNMNQELIQRTLDDPPKPTRIPGQVQPTDNMRKAAQRDKLIQERKRIRSQLSLSDELLGRTILKSSDSSNKKSSSRGLNEREMSKLKNMDLLNLGLTENTELYKSFNRSLAISLNSGHREAVDLMNGSLLSLNKCIDDNNKRLVTPVTCMILASQRVQKLKPNHGSTFIQTNY